MILGDCCTRKCTFCRVSKGKPSKIDWSEAQRIKEAIKRLNLNYVVVTSPTRDDLEDGGAQVFLETVREIKKEAASIKVEILIPDFLGKKSSLETVANSGADTIAHNLETVPSLYEKVRKGADYWRSLEVLRLIKEMKKDIYTKSGLILGLGEEDEEVIAVLRDLKKVGCDYLTIGQYLPPSLAHYPLNKYITREKFQSLERQAYTLGFKDVKSAPYVRSSYLANNL
jgi:lipoic acid synthetase